MQGARPDAVRALLGEGNAAARRTGPQTLTVFYARVLTYSFNVRLALCLITERLRNK